MKIVPLDQSRQARSVIAYYSFLQAVGRLIRWHLKQSRGVMLLYVALIAGVLPVVLLFIPDLPQRATVFRRVVMLTTALLTQVMVIIQTLSSFSHLTEANRSDFFFARPVSRQALYFGQLLGAILPMLVAQIAAACVSGVILALSGQILRPVLLGYAHLMLLTLSAALIMVLALLLNGTVQESLMLTFFFNLAWPFLVLVMNQVMMLFLPGYQLSPRSIFFNPVLFSNWGQSLDLINLSLASRLVRIFLICLILPLTLYLHHIRPAERAGVIRAIPSTGYFVQISIGVMMAFFGGFLLFVLTGIPGTFVVGMLPGVVLPHFLLELFLNRRKLPFVSSLKRLLISCVLIVALYTILAHGVFGYSRRVPDRENVVGVQIGSSRLGLDIWHEPQVQPPKYFQTPELIDEAIRLHRQVIENLNELETVPYDAGTNIRLSERALRQAATEVERLVFRYVLKSGAKIERAYEFCLPDERVEASFQKIEATSEFRLVRYPALMLDSGKVEAVKLYDKLHQQQQTLLPNNLLIDQLILAFKRDILSQDTLLPTKYYGFVEFSLPDTENTYKLMITDRTPAVLALLGMTAEAGQTLQPAVGTRLFLIKDPQPDLIKRLRASQPLIDRLELSHAVDYLSEYSPVPQSFLQEVLEKMQPLWPDYTRSGYLILLLDVAGDGPAEARFRGSNQLNGVAFYLNDDQLSGPLRDWLKSVAEPAVDSGLRTGSHGQPCVFVPDPVLK